MKMDLNSDLGESFGAWSMGDDAAMLDIVSSANVACGFHAGDAAGILSTLKAAKARNVVVGAHVAYRDLAGFGRRNMDVASADLVASSGEPFALDRSGVVVTVLGAGGSVEIAGCPAP